MPKGSSRPRPKSRGSYFLVYYETSVLVVQRMTKPSDADYPGALYAEGPFRKEYDARARLAAMNNRRPVFTQDHRYRTEKSA